MLVSGGGIFRKNSTPVEYTFKNSAREEAQTVILSDYSITVRENNAERNIPYANVVSVRLCKLTSSSFKAIIQHDGDKPVVITNQYVSNDNSGVDQSRSYATFIRVLHYHLKDKSGAAYSSGCNLEAMWKWGVLAVMFSFAFSFTGDYLGVRLLNPYVLTATLSCLMFVVIFLLFGAQFPKEYAATEIPIKLLPEA
jgi:hypothetical protein